MMLEIPGYYYDESKRKYFKIEKSQTAPSSAAWSADTVKRRRVHDTSRKAAERRAHRLKDHIKRHAIRSNRVLGPLLARETEPALHVYDVGAAAWAGGLRDKGYIPFVPSFANDRYANLPCLYVGGGEYSASKRVVYTTIDEVTIVGTYICTDENDRITFGQGVQQPWLRTEWVRCPQMSSIKYHQGMHRMLVTFRDPRRGCGLYSFAPPISDGERGRPHWLLGETDVYQRLDIAHRLGDEGIFHQCTPAPPSSDLLCVIGTNAGLVSVRSNDSVAWISAQPERSANSRNKRSYRHEEYQTQQQPREIFDQDFQQGNHNVLLAGGRQPRLWLTDLRTPDTEWTFIRHASSIAHLRSVTEHQVLVAGLENSMATYDLRFFKDKPNGTKPILTFDEYRNQAHFHTGWDVSTELGAVAAAHDDGTVKLFSLHTGRVLRSANGLDRLRTETPLKALMFQTMPQERLPSLFVGEGMAVKKYSFGVVDFNDEG